MIEVNPFMTDVPVVIVVTNVRIVGGVEVETALTDSIRVFGRIGQAARPNSDEIDLFAPADGRITPDPRGWHNIRPF